MMQRFNPATLRRLALPICLLAITLLGCRTRASAPTPTVADVAVRLAAETTAIALLMPSVTPTGTASPTATLTPTITPTPTATPQPRVRMEAAAEATRLGDYEIALDHYEQLRGHPRYGEEATYRLGDVASRNEEWARAAVAWEAYLAQWPEGRWAPEIHFMLGRALAALGQHEQAIVHFKRYDQARDAADDAVAERLADSLIALERDDEAAAQLERVYTLRIGDRVARALAARRLADLFVRLERWDEAITWYQKVLADSRVPTYRAGVIAALAEAEEKRSEPAAARRYWRALVQDYPTTPEAYRALRALEATDVTVEPLQKGRVLAANGDWDAAIQTYHTAMAAEPHSADLHWETAKAYEGAGNLEAAWKEYGSLIETHPESQRHAAAWLARAHVRAEQQRFDEALETFERVVTEFPESDEAPAAIEAAARLLTERSRPAEAAARYALLASRYPEAPQAPEALWQAGLLRFRLGQATLAAQLWERLAEHPAAGEDWRSRALFWQAKAAAAAGDEARATETFKEVVEPGGYYAARAAALLEHDGHWPARPSGDAALRDTSAGGPPLNRPFMSPDVAGDDLAWLRAAAGITRTQSFDPLALPDDPALARGDELMAINLPFLAVEAYRDALRHHRDDPQVLYGLAHHFMDHNAPDLSISAARQLMDLLELTPATMPAALAVLAYPIPYDTLLHETAARFDIDPLLLAALVYQESQWQPIAVSSAGARGLTQVMPATGREIAGNLGVVYSQKDLTRPRVSLTFGGFYLDWALRLFDDNTFAALAAYNGGAGNVRRWLVPDDDLFVESIALSETRLYIERVYDHWHAYTAIYRRPPEP